MAGAKIIGYWDDLDEMPEEGPFVCCGGPVGANVPRIEQVKTPEGAGTPQIMDMSVYRYMEANGIPRGYVGACRLNELFNEGKLVWEGDKIVPAEG